MLELLLIDDDVLFQKSAARSLTLLGHEVTVASGSAELPGARDADFDVALVDFCLEGEDAIDVVPLVRERWPAAVIVAWTGLKRDLDTELKLASQCFRVVTKHGEHEALRHLLDACAEARRVNDALQRLSAREREAVLLAAQGLSTKEIAARMGCTVKTANAHLQSAYEKLGVRGKLELVAFINGGRDKSG